MSASPVRNFWLNVPTSIALQSAVCACSRPAPLRVREHWTSEVFGDYNVGTMLIRLWMRTAIRKEITSYGTLLNTLCHEFCHHLDFHLFGLADSCHARGFYEDATLYHHAQGTPRKRLFWAPVPGGRWRIDW